jgi:hypothetical protein
MGRLFFCFIYYLIILKKSFIGYMDNIRYNERSEKQAAA